MDKTKNEILKYLSENERKSFLNDLIEAIERSKSKGNFNAINECFEDWEDIAELNSIPGFKDRVWARFNNLKDTGLINQ